MKRFVPFLAALSLTFPVGAAQAQSVTDRDIPLGASGSVRLSAGGSIHVIAGGSGNALHVHVEDYGPATPSLRIETSRERDRVNVTITGPRESIVPIGASGFMATVTAPRNVKLDVRSYSGAVHVDRVTAPMQLYAASGAITVDESDAPLTALADLGNISVSNARTMVELTCGQGDVTATLAGGWSGNLVRMESSQGNLTLNLPDGFRATYDATTALGAVHNSQASVPHAPLVFLLTQKGDITIQVRQ